MVKKLHNTSKGFGPKRCHFKLLLLFNSLKKIVFNYFSTFLFPRAITFLIKIGME